MQVLIWKEGQAVTSLGDRFTASTNNAIVIYPQV